MYVSTPTTPHTQWNPTPVITKSKNYSCSCQITKPRYNDFIVKFVQLYLKETTIICIRNFNYVYFYGSCVMRFKMQYNLYDHNFSKQPLGVTNKKSNHFKIKNKFYI